MKSLAVIKSSLFFLFIGFLLPVSSPYAAEPFVFVYSEQFPPYSWKKNEQHLGMIIDVANEAMVKQLKMEVIFKGIPWKRAQAMVRLGKADAFITLPTSQREAYTISNIESILMPSLKFFVSKEFPKIELLRKAQSFDELKEFQFVSNLGNGTWKEILRSMNVEWFNQRSLIPFFLKIKRGDIWPEFAQVGRYILKQTGTKDMIVEIPSNISVPIKPFLLHISKTSDFVHIIPQFDEIIRKMKKDGTIEKIEKAYY